jgi:glycosyltransferase involved in cell wall biosynthesis
MKIALVAEHLGERQADAYPGDPALRVLALARALAGRGHAVTVYSRQVPGGGAGPAKAAPGVTIERVGAGPRQRLTGDDLLPHIAAFAGGLADRWRQAIPDVAHAQSWTSALAALAGARGLDVPVAVSFDSLAPAAGPEGAGGRTKLEGPIARSAQAVVASTSQVRTGLGRLGVPSASVRVVPAGVDTTRFRPVGPVAERGRRSRILVVSAPGDQPELVTMLRALADLRDAELVVAGGPDPGRLARDRGHRALAALAGRLGVSGRLYCTGQVGEDGLPPLMRSADVLVHLAASPSSAMVPVEAMACGIPVVASEAHADAVIHGNTGFLVPADEPRMLARRIRQLLASPMVRDGYGIAAASRAADRYSWERIGQETEAVYAELACPRLEAVA